MLASRVDSQEFKMKWYKDATPESREKAREQLREQREECSYRTLPYIKQACLKCDNVNYCHGD